MVAMTLSKRNALDSTPRRWAVLVASGDLFPAVVDWLVGRHRRGARHRVARGGFVRVARLVGRWSGGRAAGPLDDFAHALVDRPRNASRRLYLGCAVPEHGWFGQGEDDRCRRDDARSECGVAQHRAGVTAARATR